MWILGLKGLNHYKLILPAKRALLATCYKVGQDEKWTRLIFTHLYRTSLVYKGFIIWTKQNLFFPDKSSDPEWAS